VVRAAASLAAARPGLSSRTLERSEELKLGVAAAKADDRLVSARGSRDQSTQQTEHQSSKEDANQPGHDDKVAKECAE
jgi:hypothetical protein